MPTPTPITVTAALQNIGGTAAITGARLKVNLCGYDEQQPTVEGVSLLSDVYLDKLFSGTTLSFPLYGNDVIEPLNADGTPKTFYCVRIEDADGNTIAATNYQLTGTGPVNLSQQDPYDPSVIAGIYVLKQQPCAATVFDAAKGTGQSLTLKGDIATSSAKNFIQGEAVPFIIKQDATGGRAFAWPATFADQPAINAAPNGVTTALFFLGFDGLFHLFGAALWV